MITIFTARNFVTRPPTDMPRRAISPGEGLLSASLHHHAFSPKGAARLSFTARIGRAPSYPARSASKKDGPAAPYPLCPSSLAYLSLHRVAWSILDCARRTSTFLSCAFREQEDDQATQPPLYSKNLLTPALI